MRASTLSSSASAGRSRRPSPLARTRARTARNTASISGGARPSRTARRIRSATASSETAPTAKPRAARRSIVSTWIVSTRS